MHPILFQIGDFYISTYGMLIVLGLIAGLGLAAVLARREGISTDHLFDLAFIVLLSGFIGARLLFIAVNFGEFLDQPLALLFSRTGFVFMGGFVGAAGAAIFYIRLKQMPLWQTADVLAPALALGHGFGRIGCLLAGCCYGKIVEESSPLGIAFPHVTDSHGDTIFSFAWYDHVHRGLIEPGAAASLPVIPTQIIESVANFLIFGVLLLFWRRRKFKGQILVLYLFFYGLARFGIEFLRGDLDRGIYYGLSTSQFFSLAAVVAAIVIWLVRRPQHNAPVRRGALAGK